MNNDELVHYGVKGMHWGVRRYQNPDGSLTAAGKKRERKQADKAVRKERKEAVKSRRIMSDEELNARVKRLEQEKKLKSLTIDDVAKGRTETKKLLHETGSKVAKAAVVGATAFGLSYASKKFGYRMLVRQHRLIDLPYKVPEPTPDWENLYKWIAPNPNVKKK